MNDYSNFLLYLNDSIEELLEQFQKIILTRISYERYTKITQELKIYLKSFKKKKLENPDICIDDHITAILLSYLINPELDTRNRDAHYNGVWYSFWGNKDNLTKEKVKEKCATINTRDRKWTEVCLMAVDEYYEAFNNAVKTNNQTAKKRKKLSEVFKKTKK